MNCSDAEGLLSAYQDGELAPDERGLVAAHLGGCAACSRRLEELRHIIFTSGQLVEPEPPDELWIRIEQRLDQDLQVETATTEIRGKRASRQHFAIATAAAILLACVTFGIWQMWRGSSEHRHESIDIGKYLVEYRRDPETAQRNLAEKYQGRQIDPREVELATDFRPIAVQNLPHGLSLNSMYLLEMPSCICVQSIYDRPDKGHIVVFEHEGQSLEWFGNRPAINAICNGKTTSVTQCDGELAVTWKHNARNVTVIGARNLEEVSDIVAFLGGGDRSQPH